MILNITKKLLQGCGDQDPYLFPLNSAHYKFSPYRIFPCSVLPMGWLGQRWLFRDSGGRWRWREVYKLTFYWAGHSGDVSVADLNFSDFRNDFTVVLAMEDNRFSFFNFSLISHLNRTQLFFSNCIPWL